MTKRAPCERIFGSTSLSLMSPAPTLLISTDYIDTFAIPRILHLICHARDLTGALTRVRGEIFGNLVNFSSLEIDE